MKRRFGCFARLTCSVVGFYVLLDIVGLILLSREAGPESLEVTRMLLATIPVEKRWVAAQKLMQEEPGKNAPLSYAELDRLRKIVWFANTGAPEEWEGSDRVSVSLEAVRYLTFAYPELAYWATPEGYIRLGVVEEVVGKRPPIRWIVPLVEVYRWWSSE